MEFAFNLLWSVLAAVLIRLWLRQPQRQRSRRREQCLALVVCLWILFPVISLTDDLQAAQNPAEADSFTQCQRREHRSACPHSIVPIGTALPVLDFDYAGISHGYSRLAVPLPVRVPTRDNPAMASIENRPPPTA